MRVWPYVAAAWKVIKQFRPTWVSVSANGCAIKQ